MNHFEDFCQKFKPLLNAPHFKNKQFKRWIAFEFIAKELLSKNKPIYMIETGTLNTDNDWLGYGQATLLWDDIVSKTLGKVYSIDIDLDKIKFARSKCKNINFIHCDSIGYLRGVDATDLDFLYLDSYDWDLDKHISSCLHHMTELGAIWDRLPSGCLLAVDDCHSETHGKHVLVHSFFEKLLNLKPIISCHIQIWRKP